MINISISSNLLIIISCVILFLIIGLIIYIIYKDKIVDQDEIDELIDDIVNAKPRDELEEIKVKKIESVEKPSKLNLEEMLNDMQSSLDKKQKKSIELYEKEQDENAIISIKELEKLKNNDNTAYELEQERESIINYNELNSIEKLEEKEEIMKKPVKKKIAKIESNDSHKKFKNTEFISPIFGKMNNDINYPKIRSFDSNADLDFNEYFGKDIETHQLEHAIDVEPLSDEIKKNTEFLKALKEFRSNL